MILKIYKKKFHKELKGYINFGSSRGWREITCKNRREYTVGAEIIETIWDIKYLFAINENTRLAKSEHILFPV